MYLGMDHFYKPKSLDISYACFDWKNRFHLTIACQHIILVWIPQTRTRWDVHLFIEVNDLCMVLMCYTLYKAPSKFKSLFISFHFFT